VLLVTYFWQVEVFGAVETYPIPLILLIAGEAKGQAI